MQDDHKQITQHTFDTVAPGYDHPVMQFFPTTAERMLHYLQLEPTSHLLDVCTGTGMVSVRAAASLSNGYVTGIDLSCGMLEQARIKALKQDLNNIQFRQMDLEALDFDDEYFDAATCSFGLFFVEDIEQGLRNIASKVRAGGKIAISTFVTDAFEPMASIFLRRMEAFGQETKQVSWKRISTETALRNLFTSAGMKTIDIHHESLRYPITAEDWWSIVWNAGYRGYLQQLSVEKQAEFKAQHLDEVRQLVANGNDHLNVDVLIVVARK